MPTCDLALEQISAILLSAAADDPAIPPTLLYNENWMMRIVLRLASQGVPCLPFEFATEAKWFSEARLYSRFLARHRGDRKAETHTHADAVVGNFTFTTNTKTGLQLKPMGSQFIVLEGKVFSKLGKKTQNAYDYSQGARLLGCMAESLYRSKKSPGQWKSLGFYVVAPQTQINLGLFRQAIERDDLLKGIRARIDRFASATPDQMEDWMEMWVKPLLEHIDMDVIAWENIIEKIEKHSPDLGRDVRVFYDKTLEFNARRKSTATPGRPFNSRNPSCPGR